MCERNDGAVVGDLRAASARLKTWKPPQSVRIGPSQSMKRCSPPSSAIELVAGPQGEVVGVAEDDLRAGVARACSGVRPLTVACVPTGMKTGVSTAPCGVVEPARAGGAVGVQELERDGHDELTTEARGRRGDRVGFVPLLGPLVPPCLCGNLHVNRRAASGRTARASRGLR